MGNWGGTAVAHATVAELREFAAEVGCGVDGDEDLGGGWSAVQYPDQPDGAAAALARRTGAPVLTVAYLDSDVGFVEAATFAGGRWKALLNRVTAEGYEIPVDRFPVEAALEGALDWSAAAGLTADPDAIRAALTGSAAFAEELTDQLLGALGIPAAAPGEART
ncbi:MULTISPECIES: hypothetical protein [Streptomyces]|uniref:hypothetical protein n=1 Tax=Streptomyces TaxID=1883 RepID=UPI002258943B|nr:hypothetical protein [Streptomyces sp. NBC_00160]MCX5305603.1 hypothetical protein [Streptomyces sp. NBC_00160]